MTSSNATVSTSPATRAPTLRVVPCSLKDAQRFVASLHRHHKDQPLPGHKLSLAVEKQTRLLDGPEWVRVGVAMIGNPIAPALRAKIEAMERQAPVAWTTKLALEHRESALGFRVSSVNIWGENGVPLYALPGAQSAPSVPEGWQLVPTAESRHPGIYKMLGALHAADNTPGMSEWESYRAMLAAAPEAKP